MHKATRLTALVSHMLRRRLSYLYSFYYESSTSALKHFKMMIDELPIVFPLFLGVSAATMARRNAEVILRYTNVCPFRLQGKTIICVFCCDKFTDQDPFEIRRHVEEEHKKFKIDYAFYHCGSSASLKVDISNLKCKLCLLPFISIEEVAKHISEIHDVKRINLDYSISLTPYRFDDQWGCCLCEARAGTLHMLSRHIGTHFQKFTCDACGRTYQNNEGLRYHIRCSHGAKGFPCRKCWKEFPTLELRKEHVKNSDACKPVACTTCGERFMSAEAKYRHAEEVHALARRSYVCPECGKKYNQRKDFYRHYKINHTSDNYTCTACNMKFAEKKCMIEHMLGHTGAKMYKCVVCDKAFNRQKNLKQHMWIHSEHKRFVCPVCQKQFAQKVSYKAHMKSYHSEVIIQF